MYVVSVSAVVIYLVSTKVFQKASISFPLKRTRTCAYEGVRNDSSYENFTNLLNE